MDNETGDGRKPRRKKSRLERWLNSTSRRIFLLLPLGLIAAETLIRQDWPPFNPWGAPLLVWGYVQCRLSVDYRNRLGGGGPGRKIPPDRLVRTGIYAYMRNPIYLGHLIFVLGLAITLQSWLSFAVFAVLAVWYDWRVRADERSLAALFGAAYDDYRAGVRRWVPYIY